MLLNVTPSFYWWSHISRIASFCFAWYVPHLALPPSPTDSRHRNLVREPSKLRGWREIVGVGSLDAGFFGGLWVYYEFIHVKTWGLLGNGWVKQGWARETCSFVATAMEVFFWQGMWDLPWVCQCGMPKKLAITWGIWWLISGSGVWTYVSSHVKCQTQMAGWIGFNGVKIQIIQHHKHCNWAVHAYKQSTLMRRADTHQWDQPSLKQYSNPEKDKKRLKQR